MALICLIGRHGAGKSTIGTAMRAHGFRHLSVGTLRRLARHNQFPADVPYSFMAALKRLPAGQPLPERLAVDLIGHATSLGPCILDGFPASVDHLALLPPNTVVGFVWAPKGQCEERLTKRAEATLRQWTAGRESAREAALASVVRAARLRFPLVFIRNAGNGLDPVVVTSIRRRIQGQTADESTRNLAAIRENPYRGAHDNSQTP